jgi:hypothetical protein
MPILPRAGKALAVAAVIGSNILIPTGVAYADDTPVCKDDSRKTAEKAPEQPDMRELQTVVTNGSKRKGDAQITLRYTPSMECAWGLLEGAGTNWLERAPLGSGGTDRMGERELTGSDAGPIQRNLPAG